MGQGRDYAVASIVGMCITGYLMELWVTMFAGRGKVVLCFSMSCERGYSTGKPLLKQTYSDCIFYGVTDFICDSGDNGNTKRFSLKTEYQINLNGLL